MFPNAGLLQQMMDSRVAEIRRERPASRVDMVRLGALRRTARPWLSRRSH